MIFQKFMGWDSCSFDDYVTCCDQYGFNNESASRFLKFLMDEGANLSLLSYRKKGELLGAVCMDGGWLANDHKNPRSQTGDIPIPGFSILPPFKPGVKCLAPFKSKSLSLMSEAFHNASFNLLSKRHVAVARSISDGFTKKARYNRNREIKKFLESGGEFVSVNSLAADEFRQNYEQLYVKRRGVLPHHSQSAVRFFNQHHQDFFGNMALYKGEPIGAQLLLASTSNRGVFIDYINIGYDTEMKEHSLGTIMMWNNLTAAHAYAEEKGQPLHFSYGMMSGEYKAMWCNPVKVGKVISL